MVGLMATAAIESAISISSRTHSNLFARAAVLRAPLATGSPLRARARRAPTPRDRGRAACDRAAPRRADGTAPSSRELPNATAALRWSTAFPRQAMDVGLNQRRNCAFGHPQHGGQDRPTCRCPAAARTSSPAQRLPSRSLRSFTGHTDWQSSQPQMRLPIAARNSRGIGAFSCVRSEMQRRASIAPSGPIAPVGQRSMHATHSPQFLLERFVGRQIERRDDLAEEHPRAEFPRQARSRSCRTSRCRRAPRPRGR